MLTAYSRCTLKVLHLYERWNRQAFFYLTAACLPLVQLVKASVLNLVFSDQPFHFSSQWAVKTVSHRLAKKLLIGLLCWRQCYCFLQTRIQTKI